MTEKSEDQVWICDVCLTKYPKKSSYHWANDIQSENRNLYQNNPHCNGNLTAYIPHSKYLILENNVKEARNRMLEYHDKNIAIKSDLALAVDALQEIAKIDIYEDCQSSQDVQETTINLIEIAKEALGKIGEKKSE